MTEEELQKCVGCGADFHESDPLKAGYLPQKEDRIQAYLMGIPFENYVREMGGEEDKSVSYDAYLEKKRKIGPLDSYEIVTLADIMENSEDHAGGKKKRKDALMDDRLVCARCHQLSFHRSLPHTRAEDVGNQESAVEAYKKVESHLINSIGGFVLMLCDILDFPGSLDVELIKKLGTRPVVVCVNKADLLPMGVGITSLEKYLRHYVKNTLKLSNVVETHIVSVKNRFGLTQVVHSVVKNKSSLDDIYILGSTNSGKSSFMNALLSALRGPMHRQATTSWLPGTTIEPISIPIQKLPGFRDYILKSRQKILADRQKSPLLLDEVDADSEIAEDSDTRQRGQSTKSSEITKLLKGKVIDTPGRPVSQLTSCLTPTELKYCVPDKHMKPLSYLLSPGRCLWIGGLARIEFPEGSARVIATTLISPKIPVHQSSILKSDWLWNVHAGGKSKNWEDSLIVPTGKGSVKAARKNKNKDLYAGVKFVPPFFSTPEQFVKSRAEAKKTGEGFLPEVDEEKEMENKVMYGLLKERMNEYPKFKLSAAHMITRETRLARRPDAPEWFRNSVVDIVLPGIGWVSIAGNFLTQEDRSAMIKVYTPVGVPVIIRDSMIPDMVDMRGGLIKKDPNGRFKEKKNKKKNN